MRPPCGVATCPYTDYRYRCTQANGERVLCIPRLDGCRATSRPWSMSTCLRIEPRAGAGSASLRTGCLDAESGVPLHRHGESACTSNSCLVQQFAGVPASCRNCSRRNLRDGMQWQASGGNSPSQSRVVFSVWRRQLTPRLCRERERQWADTHQEACWSLGIRGYCAGRRVDVMGALPGRVWCGYTAGTSNASSRFVSNACLRSAR